MKPDFVIFADAGNEFANVLCSELLLLGKVSLCDTDSGNHAPSPFIVVIEPFHGTIHTGQKALRLCFFKRFLPQRRPEGAYFIQEGSSHKETCKRIAEVIQGFDVWKSWVFALSTPESGNYKYLVVVPPASVEPKQVSLPKQKTASPKKLKGIKRPSVRVPGLLPRFALFLFALVVSLFVAPLLLLASAGFCSLVAAYSLTHVNISLSKKGFACAQALSVASLQTGRFFPSGVVETAQFLGSASEVGTLSASILESLGGADAGKVSSLAPSLDLLSRKAQLLSTHAHGMALLDKAYPDASALLKNATFLPLLPQLAQNAHFIFGENKVTTYLVLLQNNMELRPTGGFIGSFLVIEVQKGQMLNYKTYDVYDADGQIKGYVRPPMPIGKYLGEASWHMRDSNWDPDFETSAQRAAWFLEKAMDIRADIVVGVNLETLRTVISALGPIEVSDYNDTLDSDSFYTTIQDQVHKEFFPGSHKKSNYLTAVVNSALNNLKEKGGAKSLALISGLLGNFKSHDIQVYSTNTSVQAALDRAEVSGKIPGSAIGFVEANLGINKANQFIDRTGSVTIEKGESEVSVSSTLNIKNSASEATDETRYRVYLRSIAPLGSTLMSLHVSISGQAQAVFPEREKLDRIETAGAFFEVAAKQAAEIRAVWSVPLTNQLIFWKQPGVFDYPMELKTLTGEGARTYNSQLQQNINIHL